MFAVPLTLLNLSYVPNPQTFETDVAHTVYDPIPLCMGTVLDPQSSAVFIETKLVIGLKLIA